MHIASIGIDLDKKWDASPVSVTRAAIAWQKTGSSPGVAFCTGEYVGDGDSSSNTSRNSNVGVAKRVWFTPKQSYQPVCFPVGSNGHQ